MSASRQRPAGDHSVATAADPAVHAEAGPAAPGTGPAPQGEDTDNPGDRTAVIWTVTGLLVVVALAGTVRFLTEWLPGAAEGTGHANEVAVDGFWYGLSKRSWQFS